MEEVWKDIPGYEGRYQVSDQGRVRSLVSNKFLAPNKMIHDYLCVHLYICGRSTRRVFTIHKLVATAFIPNPNGYREVNHKNFVRGDNRAENLEWVSRKENVDHAIKGGRKPKTSKGVFCYNLQTREVEKYTSQIDAEMFLRGGQTGGISAGIKRGRPMYGRVWWFA